MPNKIETDQEQINLLQENFYSAVANCGRFSWIGTFEARDQFKRPRIFVYLSERGNETPESRDPVSIIDSFRELALALRPRVFMGLYFIPPNNETDYQLTEKSRKEMAQLLQTEVHKPQVRVLMHKSLSPKGN